MGLLSNLISAFFGNRPEHRTAAPIRYDSDLYMRLSKLDNKVGDYIPLIVQNIKPTPENPTGYTHIAERIKYIESMLSAYNRLMREASQSPELYTHFDKMWNHCHNSKVSDFSLIEKYAALLDELVATAPAVIEWERQHDHDVIDLDRRIMKIIHTEQGILQTDLSKRFPESVKTDVRNYCRYFEKTGAVIREKHGKTYALYAK